MEKLLENEDAARDAIDAMFNDADGVRTCDLLDSLERVKVHLEEAIGDII